MTFKWYRVTGRLISAWLYSPCIYLSIDLFLSSHDDVTREIDSHTREYNWLQDRFSSKSAIFFYLSWFNPTFYSWTCRCSWSFLFSSYMLFVLCTIHQSRKLSSSCQFYTFRDPLKGSFWGIPIEACEFISNQEVNCNTNTCQHQNKVLTISHWPQAKNGTLHNYKEIILPQLAFS